MKHLCPRCGRFIRWSLLLCFDCNVVLRASGGTVIVGGVHTYPPAQLN